MSNSLSTLHKEVHSSPTMLYGWQLAIVIEQQGWMDAMHNPEWGIDQICA